MEVQIGRHIKGYELKECIGSGGFGVVYRGYQSTVVREVAIKIVRPDVATQPEFIRRFEIEAQPLTRLEHPHIVPVYDYWRDPSGAFLVMRFFRGGSLGRAIQSRPYELEAAARIIDQIGSALSLAHRAGIIHRNVKPNNILLDEDGNSYLADFGIAQNLTNIQSNKLQADVVADWLDYISPEQARDEVVTPRTDIYSLGLVLYEMLTGSYPFHEASTIERLYQQLNEPLPQILSLNPHVSEGVNAVIQKATAKDPALRYEDVTALAADFRDAARINGHEIFVTSVVEQLTIREQEVLSLLVDGLSNHDIADRLVITTGTVKWYITQIYRKLHVRGRVQAIVRARELELIVDRSGVTTGVTQPTGYLVEPDNPYKGLAAFEPVDSQDFFGREELIKTILRRMAETGPFSRLIVIIGPSGSGKSSLVKGGLIPALWCGGLPDSEGWLITSVLPGSRPVDELEVALTRFASGDVAGVLGDHLQRDSNGLLRAAQLILPEDGSELVVFVDQFEELFTMVSNEQMRHHFLDLLCAAVTNTRSRVRIVIALRADFYDRPLHYPEFGEMLRNRMETILPLSSSGLERAVVKPAHRVGVTYEEGLVAQIVSEMHYQAGALPLLQYALTELFEHREGRVLTHKAYVEMGGAQGALARRAEEAFISLGDAGQKLARDLFLRLVNLGEGTEDTRRRVAQHELLVVTSQSDLMEEVIETLARYRLLTLDHDPASRQSTVEIAHEAILRHWERLRGWLGQSRNDVQLQRKLALISDEWERSGRDLSYLLRGARLEEYERWLQLDSLLLTPCEREFLDTSIAVRQRQAEQEQARQEREMALERRSHQTLRILVVLLLLIAIGSVAVTAFAVNERNRTEEALTIAEREASVNHSLVLSNNAVEEFESGLTDLALRLALEAVALEAPPSQSVRTLEMIARSPGVRALLTGHSNRVTSVAISADGEKALSASCADMTTTGTCSLGELILWNIGGSASDAGEQRRFGSAHTDWITDIEFHPTNSSMALSASQDASVILWNANTGEVVRKYEIEADQVTSVAFHPDGNTFLSGTVDGAVYLWETDSGAHLARWEVYEGIVNSVAFSSDGESALSGGSDGGLLLWDVRTGAVIRRIGVGHGIDHVAFGPGGNTVWTLSQDFFARVWNIETGELVDEIASTGPFADLAFTSNGQYAALAEEATINLWNIARGRNEQHLRHSTISFIHAIAISPDGSRLVSGSENGSVQVWNLLMADDQRTLTVPGTQALFNAVLYPDGRHLLTDDGGRLLIIELETGRVVGQLAALPSGTAPGALALSADGSSILAGSGNWNAQSGTREEPWLWLLDASTGEVLHELVGHEFNVRTLAISPDGRFALSGSMANTAGADYVGRGDLLLWDLQTGQLIRRFDYHESVGGIDISSDGRSAVTCSPHPHTANVSLWDVETGMLIRRFDGSSFGALDVAFGSDDSTILISSTENKLLLLDVESGQILLEFVGQEMPSYEVVPSPTGDYVISGPLGLAILWDYASGEEVQRIRLPAASSSWPVFSPDGTHAYIVAGETNMLIDWSLQPSSPAELSEWITQNRFVGEFTCEERIRYDIEPLCVRLS